MNRIRSLLVHVDGAAGNIARLALACDMAERHGAALTVLFAASPPLLDVPYAHVGGAIALDGLQELSANACTAPGAWCSGSSRSARSIAPGRSCPA